LINCASPVAGERRLYADGYLRAGSYAGRYRASDLPATIAAYPFIERREGVGALITIDGPMTPGSINKMSYEWHEHEDSGFTSPNRVQFFLNQEIYLDEDGYITTTGIITLLKDKDITRTLGETVSGRQFSKDWFGRTLKKCVIPAWQYNFADDTINVAKSPMFFWGGNPGKFESIYIPTDFAGSTNFNSYRRVR